MASVTSEIGAFIRAQREAAEVSLRQLAELAGVSNPYLSQIERGLRRPSADVLNSLAKALKVSSEALYEQAGYLDPQEVTPVRRAIEHATDLTERQKHTLIELYDAFRSITDNERTRNEQGASHEQQ